MRINSSLVGFVQVLCRCPADTAHVESILVGVAMVTGSVPFLVHPLLNSIVVCGFDAFYGTLDHVIVHLSLAQKSRDHVS